MKIIAQTNLNELCTLHPWYTSATIERDQRPRTILVSEKKTKRRSTINVDVVHRQAVPVVPASDPARVADFVLHPAGWGTYEVCRRGGAKLEDRTATAAPTRQRHRVGVAAAFVYLKRETGVGSAAGNARTSVQLTTHDTRPATPAIRCNAPSVRADSPTPSRSLGLAAYVVVPAGIASTVKSGRLHLPKTIMWRITKKY
jgi:hypothetical protein